MDEARALVDAWANRVGKDPWQRLHLAAAYSSLEDHDRALEELDRVRFGWTIGRAAERSTATLSQFADDLRHRALLGSGRSDEARDFRNSAAARDPDAGWPTSARFAEALRTGDPDQGEQERERAREALRAQPRDLALTLETAVDAVRRFEFRVAIDLIDRFLHSVDEYTRQAQMTRRKPVRPAPLPPQLFELQALALTAVGDQTGADAAIARIADRIGPEDADNIRAFGLLLSDRVAEASSLYESSRDKREGAESSLGLAECHLRLQDVTAAKAALARARELDADERRVALLDSRIMVMEGRWDDAAETIADVPEDPADYERLFAIAVLDVGSGRPTAQESLLRYRSLVPRDPRLEVLLEHRAPDGMSWREHLADRMTEEPPTA